MSRDTKKKEKFFFFKTKLNPPWEGNEQHQQFCLQSSWLFLLCFPFLPNQSLGYIKTCSKKEGKEETRSKFNYILFDRNIDFCVGCFSLLGISGQSMSMSFDDVVVVVVVHGRVHTFRGLLLKSWRTEKFIYFKVKFLL